MAWPFKIQGRFVTEAEVNEVRMLLQTHPSWNRTRLSRELCGRWNWQRPDGQIKDMACRELLRKLESRALIKLPPRHRYGPGRPAEIEPIAVDQSPASCLLSDIKPVKIVNVRGLSRIRESLQLSPERISLSQLCTPGRSEHEIHDRWAKRTFSWLPAVWSSRLEDPGSRPLDWLVDGGSRAKSWFDL